MQFYDKTFLVTGSSGFLGKNLLCRLSELGCKNVHTFNRENSLDELEDLIEKSDVIFHLAGENRPKNSNDFRKVNVGLTRKIYEIIEKLAKRNRKHKNLIFTSSIHYDAQNPYGQSKQEAELIVSKLPLLGVHVSIYRLPGVFGKWARPNYNSVVATFCYNSVNNIPMEIHDPQKQIKLVYIDDLLDSFVEHTNSNGVSLEYRTVKPEFSVTLKTLADKIDEYANSRDTLMISKVGVGFERCLYSTYLSYLSHENFKYEVPSHKDVRGCFVEMLKTEDSGQISMFTAHPGVTRGGHYHHTKNEKFLVLSGEALFRFRDVNTNEKTEFIVTEKKMEVVETIPGWVHDITNIGDGRLVVMLWSNEIFDPKKPDTFSMEL